METQDPKCPLPPLTNFPFFSKQNCSLPFLPSSAPLAGVRKPRVKPVPTASNEQATVRGNITLGATGVKVTEIHRDDDVGIADCLIRV